MITKNTKKLEINSLTGYTGSLILSSFLNMKRAIVLDKTISTKLRYFTWSLYDKSFTIRAAENSPPKCIYYGNELTDFTDKLKPEDRWASDLYYGFKIYTNKINYTLYSESKETYLKWKRMLNLIFNKIDIFCPGYPVVYDFFSTGLNWEINKIKWNGGKNNNDTNSENNNGSNYGNESKVNLNMVYYKKEIKGKVWKAVEVKDCDSLANRAKSELITKKADKDETLMGDQNSKNEEHWLRKRKDQWLSKSEVQQCSYKNDERLMSKSEIIYQNPEKDSSNKIHQKQWNSIKINNQEDNLNHTFSTSELFKLEEKPAHKAKKPIIKKKIEKILPKYDNWEYLSVETDNCKYEYSQDTSNNDKIDLIKWSASSRWYPLKGISQAKTVISTNKSVSYNCTHKNNYQIIDNNSFNILNNSCLNILSKYTMMPKIPWTEYSQIPINSCIVAGNPKYNNIFIKEALTPSRCFAENAELITVPSIASKALNLEGINGLDNPKYKNYSISNEIKLSLQNPKYKFPKESTLKTHNISFSYQWDNQILENNSSFIIPINNPSPISLSFNCIPEKLREINHNYHNSQKTENYKLISKSKHFRNYSHNLSHHDVKIILGSRISRSPNMLNHNKREDIN